MSHAPCSPRALRRLQWALALLGWAGLAASEPVYRCGNAYQDRPCDGGRAVEVDDARSDQQRREHAAVSAREQALAKALVAERKGREKAQRAPAQAVGIGARPGHGHDQTPEASVPDPCRPRPPVSRQQKLRCRDGRPVYQPLPTAPRQSAPMRR